MRLCDHLKAYTEVPNDCKHASKHESTYRAVSITIQLNEDDNRLLTLAAARSGRSKKIEAMLRLSHHLKMFVDIAAEGKRFS